MYKSKLLILFVSICFFGCGSSMKEFGGNIMTTTGAGSPVAALVGVGLGGVLYGIGSSIEDSEVDQKLKDAENGKLPEVTYYTQKIIPDDDQNAKIISSVDTNNSQE